MPENVYDIVRAPAAGGVSYSSLYGEASTLPNGVALAPAGIPWEGEKQMCVRMTRAGAICPNVAVTGTMHCAGHAKQVAAERPAPVDPRTVVSPQIVELPVMRPVTDERGFMIVLDVLGLGGR